MSGANVETTRRYPENRHVLRLDNPATADKKQLAVEVARFTLQAFFRKKPPRLIVLVLKTPLSFCVETGLKERVASVVSIIYICRLKICNMSAIFLAFPLHKFSQKMLTSVSMASFPLSFPSISSTLLF